MAMQIFTPGKITWAVNTFGSFKSAGPDNIFPALLKEGLDCLLTPLRKLFCLSLTLGHVPDVWRSVRVSFIPKPGKSSYDEAKSFRPISLASFILKSMERILDCYIREKCLRFPIFYNQHAYIKGRSTVTAIHKLTGILEKSMNYKENALAVFLDVEGAFDNTSFETIMDALNNFGVPIIVSNWILNMLKSRLLSVELRGV